MNTGGSRWGVDRNEDGKIEPMNVKVGDKVLINGTIGDHGIAVMAKREGLELETDIRSDCAALNTLVAELLEEEGKSIHVLRDPTRGGVVTTLKEIAVQSEVTLTLNEETLPLKGPVKGVCAVLGLDPLLGQVAGADGLLQLGDLV